MKQIPIKKRDILKILQEDGWYPVPTHGRGGHTQYRHPTKHGKVSISQGSESSFAPGTAYSILKQAGLLDAIKNRTGLAQPGLLITVGLTALGLWLLMRSDSDGEGGK